MRGVWNAHTGGVILCVHCGRIPQGVYVIQPYETHSTDPISFNFVQGQQGDSQGPWEPPGNSVEEEGFLLNGLAAPFRHGGQEPSNCQYDPPHAAGHGEEIQDHEEQGAYLRESVNNKFSSVMWEKSTNHWLKNSWSMKLCS